MRRVPIGRQELRNLTETFKRCNAFAKQTQTSCSRIKWRINALGRFLREADLRKLALRNATVGLHQQVGAQAMTLARCNSA